MKLEITRPSVELETRAVGVEDAHDMRVHAAIAVIGHGQRFGKTLGFVVDRTRSDRIDMSPIGLGLGMNVRVAIALGSRGQQESGLVFVRQFQAVARPDGADFQGLQVPIEDNPPGLAGEAKS